MKVMNKSKRLLCFQTEKGRVEVLPGVVTDDKRLDALKGKDKIFDHYVKEEIIKEVTGDTKSKQTPKEKLINEAELLGIDTTDMTKAELEEAIAEAQEDL